MGNQRATQTKATEATSQRKSATVTKPPLTRRTAVHPMLQLQRTVGNRAVNQLIERQRVAQETGVSKTSVPIQAKLTIGEPGDKYEQEADRVATQVVNQIQAPASQPSASEPSVQRMDMTEEEDEQLMTKPMVQRLSAGGEMAAPPDLEASIQQAKGGGQPLSDNIREAMEQAFGADFSGVRVHTDGTSDQLNQSIEAKAFTTGQDVFFRQGAYQIGSREGQKLLAHELTHVVQQRDSSIQPQVIQCDLGLEFQTGWQVYREKPRWFRKRPKRQEYQKETSIYGDRQNTQGWSMETDGTDIEFVVEPPFQETPAGMQRLNEVMGSLQLFTYILNNEQNQARLTPQTHPQFFQTPDPYAVIEPRGEIRAQPQATVGVRLDRMQDFFREIGRQDAQNDQNDLSASQGTDYFTGQARNAVNLASHAPPVNGQPASDKLKGLLTLIVQYLIQGNQPGRRAYAKDIAYAMARTDFAAIFSQIPEAAHFQNNLQQWVDYALQCANLPYTANSRLINQKITDGRDASVFTMTQAQLNNLPQLPLTRGQWLSDMARGVNAVDKLTRAATLNDPAYTDYKGGNRLRALGLLGNRTDNVGLNNNAPAPGIILELRQMKREIPATQWYKVARGLMTYLVALNNSHNAGARIQYTRPN